MVSYRKNRPQQHGRRKRVALFVGDFRLRVYVTDVSLRAYLTVHYFV